jgi:hypothetical protein
MKNFKILLVETLIQFTILLSISRYQPNDQFEGLLKNSLVDFQQQLQQQQQQHQDNFYLNERKNNRFFDLPINSKDYLKDIIKYNTNNIRNQLYLNPLNYLRVTDKFLEYPELQTKHSLVSFCNNANISPEVSSSLFFFYGILSLL